jgi:hypothetical protein
MLPVRAAVVLGPLIALLLIAGVTVVALRDADEPVSDQFADLGEALDGDDDDDDFGDGDGNGDPIVVSVEDLLEEDAALDPDQPVSDTDEPQTTASPQPQETASPQATASPQPQETASPQAQPGTEPPSGDGAEVALADGTAGGQPAAGRWQGGLPNTGTSVQAIALPLLLLGGMLVWARRPRA